MKESIKFLNRISNIMDVNKYYVITIGDHEILLQGRFHPKITLMMKNMKFDISITDNSNGYVVGRRRVGRFHIEITLTQ